MAISNTLRARLEVLGGRELIDLFDKIGDSAKKGFDTVDREARDATREVKKLERELKALERIARDIRASIKIDKDGVATPHQSAALNLADDIDRRTSAMRRQMAAMDDVLALGPDGGARVLGKQGDRDLLNIRETAKGLDDLIGNGRRDGIFGDVLPDADLDRILAAAERIRVENDRLFGNINERARAADEAERNRPPPRPRRDPAAPPAPDAEAKREAAEEARRKRDQEREKRIKDAQDRRAEQAARDAKRDQDYRDNMVRERQRIDDEIKRSREKLRADLEENRRRLQRDLDAQRTRIETDRTALNEQMARERRTFRDELARARADHTSEVDRINRKHQADMNQLRTDHNEQIRRERSDFLRTMGAERSRSRAQLGRERAQFVTDLANERSSHAATMARERADFTSQQMRDRAANTARLNAARTLHRDELNRERLAHTATVDAERRRFSTLLAGERAAHIARLTADRAAIARLNSDLAALRAAFAGINRGGRDFTARAPRLTAVARGIGRAFSDAGSDVWKFVNALKGLEFAVGKSALRVGIGSLLGVLAAGLAALGGAAVLAGISAIAVLASFNAQKLENAAASVGQALDSFTAMKYAAGSQGIMFDDYVAGAQALRTAMIGIMKQEEQFAGASELFQKFQIPLLTSDGKDLTSQFHVLRRMADLVKAMPNDNVRIEFLTNIGGPELAKLLPMLKDGSASIDDSARRAMEMGVVLTAAQVAELEKLKIQAYDIWQIMIGLSYKLAAEIMPSLIPVLQAINNWMLANEGAITGGLVKTFDYLIQVTKDFWNLWNSGGDADVVLGWTATFWYVSETIINALNRIWDGIVVGYELAKPALTAMSDYFGMSGPLEAALTILAGQLIGTTGLFIAVGKFGAAAARIVTNALKNLLLPAAQLVLGVVTGIIGWPLLLVAGLAGITLYWDKIEQLFTWAWAEFKKTFPNTAAYLEETFGDALEVVKNFTTDMLGNFRQRFPEVIKLFDTTRAALDSLWTSMKSLNWGLVFEGLNATGIYLIEQLSNALETLSPILRYLVENTLGSIKTILEQISQYWTNSKIQGQIDGQLSAELSMDPEMFKAYSAMLGSGNTLVEQKYGNNPVMGNVVDQMLGRASVQSPMSLATQVPTNAPSAAQTPVTVNLSNGDTIVMMTEEEGVAERLSKYSRTSAASSPGWNR